MGLFYCILQLFIIQVLRDNQRKTAKKEKGVIATLFTWNYFALLRRHFVRWGIFRVGYWILKILVREMFEPK